MSSPQAVLKRMLTLGGVMLLGISPLGAAGLSTPFADVRVENVPLGKPFIVTHSSGDGLILTNLEGKPVRVSLRAFQPSAAELRRGAAPIPSLDWVRIEPDQAVIPAHGRMQFRITLNVPKNKANNDQVYQVMIWSRGQLPRSQGVGFNAGLISRLQFKTEPAAL